MCVFLFFCGLLIFLRWNHLWVKWGQRKTGRNFTNGSLMGSLINSSYQVKVKTRTDIATQALHLACVCCLINNPFRAHLEPSERGADGNISPCSSRKGKLSLLKDLKMWESYKSCQFCFGMFLVWFSPRMLSVRQHSFLIFSFSCCNRTHNDFNSLWVIVCWAPGKTGNVDLVSKYFQFSQPVCI